MLQIDKEGPESVIVKEILLELRNYRMGLIQTPDQLKFSYTAIVAGAKELGHISQDALPDLAHPPPPPRLPSSDSDDSDDDDDSDDEDDDEEEDEAPPLPPRRNESLLLGNVLTANGIEPFVNLPDFLHGKLLRIS